MLTVVNPATAEVIRELEEDGPAAVADKYRRARAAQPAWAERPLGERVAAMKRFRALVADRREQLAKVLTAEVGKPITQSRSELTGVLPRVDFFVDNVGRVMRDETVLDDPAQQLQERIAHEPLGVVANISAWNYPWYVGSNVFVPALLTGNAVLYKPSELATLTGLAIADLLWEAGIPREVFIPLVGGGAVGAELLGQPIDGVFFTGSYATGMKIAEAAARGLIKVQLELGGKDPIYVAADVEPAAAAAATADGAFYNTGQSCCSVERLYVHAKVHDAFVDAFVREVKGFVAGDPMDAKTYVGPITRERQLAVLERQVQDALEKGAKLLTGGRRVAGRKGFWFEPTVLVDVNHSMELMREESFGPIIGIQRVASDEEALRLMNDTRYGLTAGVYTIDEGRARRLMAALNAGSVYWNCCDRVSPRLPWTGRGHSGIGSTLSTYGIQTFLRPKAWHLKRSIG